MPSPLLLVACPSSLLGARGGNPRMLSSCCRGLSGRVRPGGLPSSLSTGCPAGRGFRWRRVWLRLLCSHLPSPRSHRSSRLEVQGVRDEICDCRRTQTQWNLKDWVTSGDDNSNISRDNHLMTL